MREQQINELFNILVQYEKMFEVESDVTEESYTNYLNRLWVWYTGKGNEEIANSLKGLEKLGAESTHESVRRIVFHLISLIEREKGA